MTRLQAEAAGWQNVRTMPERYTGPVLLWLEADADIGNEQGIELCFADNGVLDPLTEGSPIDMGADPVLWAPVELPFA